MPDDILNDLGKRMRTARKTRGFTQERLSVASGVSVRHISKIEQGEMNPSYEVLHQLTSALGVSLSVFFASYQEPSDTEIQELIHLYKNCPIEFRPMFQDTLQAMVNSIKDRFPHC